MIPQDYITAWSSVVPWVSQQQVEQDLLISRAIVAIFSEPFLRAELRFRGGTALNKLHFPAPLRYSEDIDLVRTTAGPLGPVLNGIRSVLEPWLGTAKFDPSPVAPKLRFRVDAEGQPADVRINLKIEVNTREREAYIRLLRSSSASKIRGSRTRAQSRPFRARKCSLPNFGLCFNATRVAIYSTSIMGLAYSRG